MNLSIDELRNYALIDSSSIQKCILLYNNSQCLLVKLKRIIAEY